MSTHLPPTTNTLDPQERTRLIRSTRKLGAVLGATPYLLEQDIPLTSLPIDKVKNPMGKALKRQGSIFTHRPGLSSVTSFNSASSASLDDPSPAASLISLPQSIAASNKSRSITPPGLSTTRKRNSGKKPHPPCLCFKSASVTPTDSRFPPSLHPPTPSRASVSCFPPSPRSPDFSAKPNIGEIRRKQMAKLTRHLGEKIPPELVLASSSRSKHTVPSPDHTSRKRSVSVGQMIKGVPFVHVTKPSASQTQQNWIGEWNRSNIRDVQKELRNLRTR